MTDASESKIEWRSWDDAAFATAERTGRPILLCLTASWCEDCRRMDTQTYDNPRIAAHVNDTYVPIRVDIDRRPRIRARYNMGGFPSTVFCTPTGEIISGATYLGPEGFRSILRKVRSRWETDGHSSGRVPRALQADSTPSGEVTPAIEAHFLEQLEARWDERFAGWGTEAKFPLPRTVEFALKRDPTKGSETLDAIGQALQGDDGGFARYARARDWSDPSLERVLDANAGLIRAFATGYLYTGDETYRETAREAVGFLTDRLRSGEAFAGSISPQGDLDRTVFAGGNALAADALLAHGSYTGDTRSLRLGKRTLESLEEALISTPPGIVAHLQEGSEDRDDAGSGDQVETDILETMARVVRGYTRLIQVRDEGTMVAVAVADRAIELLHDAPSFRDGPPEGHGLLDRPLRPIDPNVELADALLDLAVLVGDDTYRRVAEDTIAAFAGATDRMGVQVAGYGGVASRLCRGSLVIDVGTPPASDLHRAALRVADHEKVVVPDSGDVPTGTAAVRGADRSPVKTPSALMDHVVAATTDGRTVGG